MTSVEKLAALFLGSEHKHGQSVPTGSSRTEDGKQEHKCWTADGPATLKNWESHVSGKTGVGIIPIRKDTCDCRFGAVDIDTYDSEETLLRVNTQVYEAGIPVVVCRSKSGGAHLFLFLSEWVPAELLREKLEMIAGFLGHASTEIFPAQGVLDKNTANGNWINMPYFGKDNKRYALHPDGSPMTLEQFLAYTKHVILTKEKLISMSFKRIGATAEIFPDGPPCLESIFQRVQGQGYRPERNNTMFNVAVYAQHRWPDNPKARDSFVQEVNSLFSEPLSLAELNKTILSQDKKGKTKDYKYQCKKCPLRDHCCSKDCRQRKYGIAAYNGSVVRTLAKIDTDPPIWLLTVNDKRISLTTEELFNYSKLQCKVMESANIIPAMMKASEWQDNLALLLKEVHIIRTFEFNTDLAEMVEKVHSYLYNRSEGNQEDCNIQNVLNGLVHKKDREAIFLPEPLYKALDAHRDKDKRLLIKRVLSEYFDVKTVRPNGIKPRKTCLAVPIDIVENEEPPQVREESTGNMESTGPARESRTVEKVKPQRPY